MIDGIIERQESKEKHIKKDNRLTQMACFECDEFELYKDSYLCLKSFRRINNELILMCRKARERLGMFNSNATLIDAMLDDEFVSILLPKEPVNCEACYFFEIIGGERICDKYGAGSLMVLDDRKYLCAEFLDKKKLEE